MRIRNLFLGGSLIFFSFCPSLVSAATVEKMVVGVAEKKDAYVHIIMNGQSLSTGHQSYPVLSTENVEGNYMIGNQIWINYGNSREYVFNPLTGNIASSFLTGKDVKSRSAGTIAECPLLAAVNHIRLKRPKMDKILATSVGVSGASVEELSKESEIRSYYKDFLRSLDYGAEVARNQNSNLYCPVIFWMQGEFNYSPNKDKGMRADVPNTTDREEYKALLLQLKNNMQDDILSRYGQKKKPVFITYQTGAQYMRDTLSISMAQLEAANENPDIICAGPIYPMTDRGGHLDANGYRWYGEMLGKVYYQTQIKKKEFKPLQPVAIKRTSHPNQIRIKFHVPVPPLVFDVNTLPKIRDYGFEVYLNDYRPDSRQKITNITIEKDEVVLTCQQSLEGEVIIMYAGTRAHIDQQENGKNHLQGHGNLRDSDPYKAFYTYIDLDKKNEDGSFVYPREDFETTLRPDYEPKDESGQIIYDKAYPLYNFSVGFYYKLPAGCIKFDTL